MTHLTWLDNNSWLLELGPHRLLIDPWLVGDLVFGQQKWLFRGVKLGAPTIDLGKIDLILLSQGLEDHAHPPTLAQLDRAIPVVGSPAAARVAQGLGYHQVTALGHGQVFELGDWLRLEAVPGAPLGPLTVENGYVISDRQSGLRLFYEPHGFHAPSLQAQAPMDVVITPVLDLALPLVGPIIRGQASALERVEWLQPQLLLPTAAAAETQYTGLLASLLQSRGSAASLQHTLGERGLTTRVISPTVGERLSLEITPRQSR
jgi:L-ascorbate metabolism protein UlaG (beta-lactamase superfamily)